MAEYELVVVLPLQVASGQYSHRLTRGERSSHPDDADCEQPSTRLTPGENGMSTSIDDDTPGWSQCIRRPRLDIP